MEILITAILVFILPLLSVILDKKKRGNTPKVKSRRIVWTDGRPAAAGEPAAMPPRQQATGRQTGSAASLPRTDAIPEQDSTARAVQAAAAAERKRQEAPADALSTAAAFMEAERSTRTKTKPAETAAAGGKKEYTEKQKLIIYSEILKPKFDG